MAKLSVETIQGGQDHSGFPHLLEINRHLNGLITLLTRLLELLGVTFGFVLLCNISDLCLQNPEAGWQSDSCPIGVSVIPVLV